MGSTPYVIEGEGNKEKSYELFARLLKDRIVFITGMITPSSADSVVAQLLFLESSDSDKDINFYINSPGGHIDAMYAIYDTMNYIKPDIATIGYGTCASAASFLLAAGTKGKRYALKNANIMIHELSSGAQGKYNDIKTEMKHLDALYGKMAKQYVKMTGQPLKKIKDDMERDYHMSAVEAKKYGIVDSVAEKRA
jgi:ATP-dependent Clp protease protease subunit